MKQEFERLVAGERFVARLRLAFAAVSLVMTLLYFFQSDPEYWNSIYALIVILVLWGAFSAVYLFQFSRGYYKLWMSYVSVTVDFLTVTATQVAYLMTLPLNFVNGPLTSCYFVVIGLAALRKSRRLLFYSGIGSAIVHLALSAVMFTLVLPSGYALVSVDGQPLEITFLDEVVRAVLMVLVAIVLGHMTRQLVDSERQYHDLFEHVPDGILILSKSGIIMNVNRALAKMAGAPAESLEGRHVDGLLKLETNVESGLFTIKSDYMETSGVLVRADETELPVHALTAAMIFKDEQCIEMSVRDVTERLHLERQLAQSQKMETLGRLSSGLAHDFNNLLGGILGSASLLDRNISRSPQISKKEKLFHHISVIRECSEQARDIISRLMSFSRTRALNTLPVNLNQVVSDVATIARNTLGDRIVLHTDITATTAVARGNETALSQALLNLCINAKDAMPEGGEVTILLKDATTISKPAGAPVDADVNDYWCIEVADTGSGIDPDNMDKIFEPFFTTKPEGEGTGLGLPMVHNIVREHGGFVNVQTEQEKGACFQIFLPKIHEKPRSSATTADDALPEGRGTILVCDDNRHLRSSVKEMLTDLGYDVIVAADGQEALKRIETQGRRIDLCILDIIMPRMDGDELLKVLKTLDNAPKVIIASGYLDKVRGQTIRYLGVAGQLAKPYTMSELAHMVAEALEKDR